MKKFINLVLAGFVGGVVFFILNFFFVSQNEVEPALAMDTIPVKKVLYSTPMPLTPAQSFAEGASTSVHAVVHIKAKLKQRNQVYNRFFDIFEIRPQYYERTVMASGSGVIISEDGYIVTNNHVVQNAFELEVTLNDRRVYPAKVIGTDASTDLALLKIEETHLPFLLFEDSDKVKVGEWVLAVGNPFNLTSTVTAGIVSAKARNINILGLENSIESFIQTDAAVNPGNSGGALVNTHGGLIGINAAIASNTGSYSGYSFAIPANLAKKVVSDLKEYGRTQRAYLGISYKEIDAKTAKEKGLDEIKGIYIEGVYTNSAAEHTGLEKGDILLKIDGKEINMQSELTVTLGTKHPGDSVLLSIKRDGKLLEKTAILENKFGKAELLNNNQLVILGATIETLSPTELKKLNIANGYKVVQIENGTLRTAGIQKGFIIMEINNHAIRSLEELNNYLTNPQGGILIGGINKNGRKAYYGFGL